MLRPRPNCNPRRRRRPRAGRIAGVKKTCPRCSREGLLQRGPLPPVRLPVPGALRARGGRPRRWESGFPLFVTGTLILFASDTPTHAALDRRGMILVGRGDVLRPALSTQRRAARQRGPRRPPGRRTPAAARPGSGSAARTRTWPRCRAASRARRPLSRNTSRRRGERRAAQRRPTRRRRAARARAAAPAAPSPAAACERARDSRARAARAAARAARSRGTSGRARPRCAPRAGRTAGSCTARSELPRDAAPGSK